jgi:hypothetical protein
LDAAVGTGSAAALTATPTAGAVTRSGVVGMVRRHARLLAIAFTLLVVAPVLAVVITRTGRTYLATSDLGVIDLRIRDIWNGYIPLVGPYSRFGWSHPGPALFFLLAIPNGIFGHAPWTTQVGGALLQGGAVCWIASLAWRRGGLALVVATMTAVSLVYASTGAWVILEPWNPYIALPFFCLFVFQCWLVATGAPKHLPGLAFVASFLVQTHVGYLPLVVAALAVVVVCALRDRASPEMRSAWRRPLAFAAGITAVMWVLPAIDLVFNRPGNIERMARYFVNGDTGEPVAGVTHALGLMAAEFKLRPAWLGASDKHGLIEAGTTASIVWLLVPVAILALSWWVSRGRPAPAARRLWTIAAVLLPVAVLTLSRVTGWLYPYLFQWRPVIAVLVVFASAGLVVVARRLLDLAGVRMVLAGLAVVTVCVFSGSMAFAILRDGGRTPALERMSRTLVDDVADRVPPGGVILRLDPTTLIGAQKGIFDELARRGKPVFVDERLGYLYGEQHGATPADVDAVWWVAETGYATTVLERLPGAKVIARYSPLPPRDEARLERLQRELIGRFEANGTPQYIPFVDSALLSFAVRDLSAEDRALVDEVAGLNQRAARGDVPRTAIVAFPAGSAPTELPYAQYVGTDLSGGR